MNENSNDERDKDNNVKLRENYGKVTSFWANVKFITKKLLVFAWILIKYANTKIAQKLHQ